MMPKLLPLTLAGLVLLLGGKLVEVLVGAPASGPGAPIGPAQASSPAPTKPKPQAAAPPPPPPAEPTAEEKAERAVLLSLRQRRAELEAREQTLAQREATLQAAEQRLQQRAKELTASQQRLEATSRGLTDREEQGWRQMAKLYEGMKPREAAGILDDLELPVLLGLMQRMSERRAAPLLAAMKPERARVLTTELARSRVRPAD
jgi:flagellar motility protein MotE (MotC chaperone)